MSDSEWDILVQSDSEGKLYGVPGGAGSDGDFEGSLLSSTKLQEDAASINKFLELNIFPEPQPPPPAQRPQPHSVPKPYNDFTEIPRPSSAPTPLAPHPSSQPSSSLEALPPNTCRRPGSPMPARVFCANAHDSPASTSTRGPTHTLDHSEAAPAGAEFPTDSSEAPWLGFLGILYLAALVCCTPMAAQEGWLKRLACLQVGMLMVLVWAFVRKLLPPSPSTSARHGTPGGSTAPLPQLPSPTAVWWLFCHYALTALLLTATLYGCILCCASLLGSGRAPPPPPPQAPAPDAGMPPPTGPLAVEAALRGLQCVGVDAQQACAAADLKLYVQQLQQQLAHRDMELKQKSHVIEALLASQRSARTPEQQQQQQHGTKAPFDPPAASADPSPPAHPPSSPPPPPPPELPPFNQQQQQQQGTKASSSGGSRAPTPPAPSAPPSAPLPSAHAAPMHQQQQQQEDSCAGATLQGGGPDGAVTLQDLEHTSRLHGMWQRLRSTPATALAVRQRGTGLMETVAAQARAGAVALRQHQTAAAAATAQAMASTRRAAHAGALALRQRSTSALQAAKDLAVDAASAPRAMAVRISNMVPAAALKEHVGMRAVAVYRRTERLVARVAAALRTARRVADSACSAAVAAQRSLQARVRRRLQVAFSHLHAVGHGTKQRVMSAASKLKIVRQSPPNTEQPCQASSEVPGRFQHLMQRLPRWGWRKA